MGNNGDLFPTDGTEWNDPDGDSVGDNGDFLPNDATQQVDADEDGCGDNRTAPTATSSPATACVAWTADGDGVADA